MKFRTTLILVALLAVVGVYLVWDLTRAPTPRDPGAAGAGGAGLVLNLQKFEFRGISVRPADGPRVDLRINDDDQWELADPPVPAGTTAIADYVTRLMTLRSSGAAPAALQQGFTPAVTVSINILGGRLAELAVARPNAIGDTVARLTLDGRTRWLLVPRDTSEALIRDANGFRESRLVAVPSEEVGLVTLQYPDRWIRVTRDAEGWGFDFGEGTASPLTPVIARGGHRAEGFVVTDLVRSLTSLRAAAFPAGPGLEDGFDRPQLVVRYTRFDATSEVGGIPGEREVRFGRYEDSRRERVLALSDNPPVRALVTAASFSALQLTPERLRDRRVFLGLSAGEITGLTLVRGEVRVELTRGKDADGNELPWQVNGEPADASKVGELLEEIASLRATRYGAEPLEGEAWEVTVRAGEREWTLRVTGERLELVESGGAVWRFESPTDLPQLLAGDLRTGSQPAPAP